MSVEKNTHYTQKNALLYARTNGKNHVYHSVATNVSGPEMCWSIKLEAIVSDNTTFLVTSGTPGTYLTVDSGRGAGRQRCLRAADQLLLYCRQG